MQDITKKMFNDILINVRPEADKEYSSWKATRRSKKHVTRIHPLKSELNKWVRSDEDKAELFAEYLAKVFKLYDIQSSAHTGIKIKPVSPLAVTKEIGNIHLKKASGVNKISPGVLKQFSRKGILLLTYIFNVCFCLEHVPECFKIFQINQNKKLLHIGQFHYFLSKIVEKLLLKRFKPLLTVIPEHKFNFRNQRSIIDRSTATFTIR